MPRRSKVELSEDTRRELENQFYLFLDSLSFEEKQKFFGEFLTDEEKMMMYKRLALYWMLFEGYSLASIQRSLGVTHDTTRLYNKRKNQMSEDFKTIISRIGRSVQAASFHKPLDENPNEVQTQAEEFIQEQIAQPNEATEQVREELSMENKHDDYIPSVEKHEEEKLTEEIHKEEMEESKDISAFDQTYSESIDKLEENNEDKNDEKTYEMRMENTQEEMQEKSNEMEGQSTKSYDNDEKKDNDSNDNSGEKKKKGFARFFGF